MFGHEVRGCIRENGEVIPFVTITPPCENTYQAGLYVMGKFHGMDIAVDYDSITRILD